jgi:asparagine synthase (glutamine-hydrolysing)
VYLIPGLFGIISKQMPETCEKQLQTMLASMLYENFYTSGTYSNSDMAMYVGWVCHKDSFADCMPVLNEQKDLVLIFSGENFPDNELEGSLKRLGHAFDPYDAGSLIHLCEEKGEDFLKDLNGWFSGVLLDLRKHSIVLFNDRYGLSRIYYHENAEGFYFSSEAKSLLKVLPELRQLDLTSLAETFSCGCVLQNRTLFSNISLLPGGSKWIFTGTSDIRKDSYFSRELWESQPLLSGAEYYEKLKETFTRILPKYFRGERPLAMSLTGGIDGRMIMAWANRPSGGLPCYTFGGTYRDSTDVRIARRVAETCKQYHKTIVIGNEFISEFPRLAEKAVFVSDGTMDVSGSVELFANQIASGIAPVRLTGNYGSEILRGNIAFKPSAIDAKLLEPAFSELVGNASTTYQSERRCHKVAFIAFKQVPWHHSARLAVEQSQLTLRSPFLDNDLVALMYQAPPDLVLSKEPSLRLIADGNRELANIPTDRGILYQPIPVITRFQQLYLEFTAKAEYAYDHGMPQWLAGIDGMLAPLHIERLFLGRHKFYHFRVWYRDKLSEYLKDILLDSRALTRPYLNGKRLDKILLNHIQGKQNYTKEIHKVLTAELIQRQLIEMK